MTGTVGTPEPSSGAPHSGDGITSGGGCRRSENKRSRAVQVSPAPGRCAVRAGAVRGRGDGLPRGDLPRPRVGCLPRCEGSALSRQGRHAQERRPTARRSARPGECRLQPGPGAHALRAKAVRRCGDGLPRGDPPRPRAGCLPRCARWRAIPTGAVRASRDGLPRGDPPRPGECRLQPGSGAHALRARADTQMRRRPTAGDPPRPEVPSTTTTLVTPLRARAERRCGDGLPRGDPPRPQ